MHLEAEPSCSIFQSRICSASCGFAPFLWFRKHLSEDSSLIYMHAPCMIFCFQHLVTSSLSSFFTWAVQTWSLLIFVVNRAVLLSHIWSYVLPGIVFSWSLDNSHFPSVCHNCEPKAEFNYILKTCQNGLQLFLFLHFFYHHYTDFNISLR